MLRPKYDLMGKGKAVKGIKTEMWGLCICFFCAVPKYSVLTTVADAAPLHSIPSSHIMRYITSTPINGSRPYYTLLIQSWFSYIQTVSYWTIYWYGQDDIMLAFPSTSCWDWNMIWRGGQSSKGDRGKGARAPRLFFSVLYKSTLHAADPC